MDLSDVWRRIRERRAYTAGIPHAAVDADTDLLERLAIEVDSLRYANASLRQVIDSMSPRTGLADGLRTTNSTAK